PGREFLWRSQPLAQEKLRESVASPKLVLLGCLAGAHHVTQRLMGLIRDPGRRELTAAVQSRQLGRVTPVRLHSVAGLHWDEGRRDHVAVHAQTHQLPIQRVAARSRLVAGLDRPRIPQLPYELADAP